MTMRLNIITPEGTLVDQEVDRVEFPGAKGRFVVLKDHAPIVSSLVEGDIVFGPGPSTLLRDRENELRDRENELRDREGQISISSGFVEVHDNQIIACVEK